MKPQKGKSKPKLTIIILNYNTKDLLDRCLKSIGMVKKELPITVIVSDNGSIDGSREMVMTKYPWVKLITGSNISFSNGNNRARPHVDSEYVLFLNSDTLMRRGVLKETVHYLDKNKDVGALSCKLILANGGLDKDARRRFPRVWISFNRLFLGRGEKYWYDDISPDIVHEVDAIEGAFFLTRKKILDKVNWFDEKYIFDGEDLDLCFQIKKLGYKIVYYGKTSIIHIKKATKNNVGNSFRIMQGVDSMEHFYRKNLWKDYPLLFNYFVVLGIKLLKLIRLIKSI